MISACIPETVCQYCAKTHAGICPLIKSIEYNDYGGIKRVEFHGPAQTVIQLPPPLSPIYYTTYQTPQYVVNPPVHPNVPNFNPPFPTTCISQAAYNR